LQLAPYDVLAAVAWKMALDPAECLLPAELQESPEALAPLLRGAGVVLLQREVPEHVNEAVAAAARTAGVPVLLVGAAPRLPTCCIVAAVF
jgi:hypothetical protein